MKNKKQSEKPVTLKSEAICVHEGTKLHFIECPIDFLDYFNAFIDYKDNNFLDIGTCYILAYHKKNSDLKKASLKKIDLKNIETTDQIKLSKYSKKELKEIIESQARIYNQHHLSDLSNISPREHIKNINLKHPVRPVFLELFELTMWYFMQYLYEIDIQPPPKKRTAYDVKYDYENLKYNLALLVQNTLYTNKNIEAPVNIDLSKYNLPAPRKISKKYSVYGEIFIEAANLYRRLRIYWLSIAAEYPPMAELLETLLMETATFGYKYCNTRYVKTFSRGGVTRDRRTERVRIIISNLYEMFKEDHISMAALANKILFSNQTRRSINLLRQRYFVPVTNTVINWIREWDAENNIDRSHYPRAPRARHH